MAVLFGVNLAWSATFSPVSCGRFSMKCMDSVGLWLVAPTRTHRPLSVTSLGVAGSQQHWPSHWYSRMGWHCSVPFAAIAFRTDRFFLNLVLLFAQAVCRSAVYQIAFLHYLGWFVRGTAAPSKFSVILLVLLSVSAAVLGNTQCLCFVWAVKNDPMPWVCC